MYLGFCGFSLFIDNDVFLMEMKEHCISWDLLPLSIQWGGAAKQNGKFLLRGLRKGIYFVRLQEGVFCWD